MDVNIEFRNNSQDFNESCFINNSNTPVDDFNESFGKESVVTDKFLGLFHDRVLPCTLENEISFLADNSIHSIYTKCINNNLKPKSYANSIILEILLKENDRIKTFELKYDFELSWMYLLNNKINKLSTNSSSEFNLNYVETLTEKKIDFEYYLPRSKEYYYCYCNNEYNFYEKLRCSCSKCNSKLLKVSSVVMFDLRDLLTIFLSDPDVYNWLLIKTKYFNTKITLNDKLFDIFDGVFMKKLISSGFYRLADLCVTTVNFFKTLNFKC